MDWDVLNIRCSSEDGNISSKHCFLDHLRISEFLLDGQGVFLGSILIMHTPYSTSGILVLLLQRITIRWTYFEQWWPVAMSSLNYFILVVKGKILISFRCTIKNNQSFLIYFNIFTRPCFYELIVNFHGCYQNIQLLCW